MTRAGGRKQKDLPGMENRRIEPLHTKAIEYYAVMRERMRLTEKEVELKKEVLSLYEKVGKGAAGYHCDGVDVEYDPGEPKPATPSIKVKVTKAEAEDDDETQSSEVKSISPQDGADFETPAVH